MQFLNYFTYDQLTSLKFRTIVICVSLVLVVGLGGCDNGSDDVENITPTSTIENINDNSGLDENSPVAGQNNSSGSVTWATDQTNVLIRWYGREAAGLPVYAPESNNNPSTILPGSPAAPTLKVERRTLPSNTYEVIASGITRINDQSEAQDLIDSGDWWQEISTYVTNSQQIPADEVNISNVYSVFDENPMAAEFWANSHHELALLLGMGFVDEELENGKKYQYRVSLEEANAEAKIIGYTPHIKVGKQLDLPVEVYASSNAEEVFEAENIDASEAHDANWLGDQAPRRWVNQSVYVGWKYPTQQNEESITASGYNIYRYAVDSDLEQLANTNPLKINSNPVLPGGSGQGWIQDQQVESQLIGIDSDTQQNQYNLESPTPSQTDEDQNVLPGYFAVDDSEFEDDQLYCYAIAPIDFFGNEGPKTPENHQNGADGNCATFESQLPPEPPSNLIGQIRNAQIELQWDVIDGADHFSVYRAEVEQGQPYPASPGQWNDVSEFGDWSLIEDVADGDKVRFIDNSAASLPQNDQEEIDYWYRARTWDAKGNRSPLSQPVFIFLRDSKAPTSPDILTPGSHLKDPGLANPGLNGPCIQIQVDSDTDFVQIYRKLESGSYELIATIPAEEFDDLEEWCDPSLAGVVGFGDAVYIAQAHDSDGNYSWSAEYTAIFGDGSLFDAPVILDIVPQPAQAGAVVNKITWLADTYPAYDKFHIYRFESNTDIETIPAQLLGMQATASVSADDQGQDVEDLGNGFVQAIFKDAGLVEGSSDYYYVVSAYRNSDQAEQYSDPVKALPSQTTGLPYSTRDVGRANWCSSHTYFQDVGVEINWDHRKTVYKQECEENKTSESLENINTGAHLIFRSRHKDFGYVQIAPVLGGTPHSDDLETAEKFYSISDIPSSDMGIAYLDEDASFGTYWYVVVTLDIDSGEPVTVTEPQSIKLEDLTGLPEDQFTSSKCRQNDPVELDTFKTPEKLIFGDGTPHKSVVIVCKWSSVSQTSRKTLIGIGEGYVEFVPPGQEPIFITVNFDGIKVNADGTVYGGYAKTDHAPILVDSISGLNFSVENIFLDSETTPGSKADIKVLLDDSIFIVEGGEKSKTIELSGISVTNTFGFEVKKVLTNSVPAAASVAVPDIPDDTWPEQLDWYLVMDELPLAFISKSLLISDKKIISNSFVVGRYFERFNNRGIIGPVDRKPINAKVNSNDAVFQSTTFNVESFEITSDGVKGELISDSNVNYVPSIPYAASIKSKGGRFTLDGSSIVNGTFDPGSASTQYSSGPSDFNTQVLKSEFDNLKFGSGGLVTGDVTPTTQVSWYSGKFAINPDEFENRVLVIPPLYSSGLPAKDPVLSTFTKLDSPYDQYQTLWDPIDTDPYWLMPGFNFSGTGRIKWACIDSDIPTDADLYVRQSGVTHAFSAQDGVGGITPDGYSLGFSKVDLGFLDSDIEYHRVGVEVDLPYPANFTFSGNVTDFADGCIGEFANASGGTDVLADHWNLDMRPAVAEFLSVGDNVQKRLFFNGGIKLPHNVNDQGTQAEWTPIKSRWEPEGLSKQTIFNQTPLISLQGISYLLKSESGITLRNPVVGEIPADPEPVIDTFANVVDRPDCLECPGWISYNGTITVPYFGKLVSTNNPQSEDIKLHVFTDHEETTDSCSTCSDYIGSSGISANQTWISEAGLELDYPLVISKNNGFGLTLAGVDRLAVLPYEPADLLEIITFDTSTVIESNLNEGTVESNTGLFIGLSSVPAVVKAINDSLAINENGELPPTGENGMGRWLTKFVGNNKPISDTTFDLYAGSEDVDGAPGCTSVLEAIWGNGDWTYDSVYGLINAEVELETGCFNVDLIDQEIAEENNEDELNALLALGGGVGQALDFDDSDYQTEFNFVRGNVLFTENIGGPGSDFDRFDLALRTKIADGEDVFLKTPRLSFSYDKSGDFTIAGKDVQAHMFEYDIERADFTLTISTAQNNIGINGGVTYYDGLEFEVVNLHVVSGVFGIGQDVLYVGLMGEGELTEEIGGQVGAAILIGRINQSSATVLTNHGFADLVERVPLEDALTGVYVRALGTIPIINDGCMLSLYVGGEVEIWYFTGEEDVYGGSIRGFAYGDALCVISARGDVTLSFYKTETPNGQPAHVFEGDAWVCGGIGFDCDPGTWGPNWSGRWWGDSWCWQAGAAADVIWQSWNGWDYSLSADYE
jgi:hypothetical protein